MAVAHITQNLDEHISGANGAQKRQAPIATERDEMLMAAPVMPNKFVGSWIGKNTKTPTLLKPKGSGTRKS